MEESPIKPALTQISWRAPEYDQAPQARLLTIEKTPILLEFVTSDDASSACLPS